jgi:hypothetical protein
MRFLLLFLVLAPQCSAGLAFTFDTDNTAGFSLTGNTYTRLETGLVADGVTFDATLTVLGFDAAGAPSDLNLVSTGVGVTGNGSNLVNGGEYLQFTVAISNVDPGAGVVFDGFDQIDFNSFENGDEAVLSIDSSAASLGDNQDVTGTGGGSTDVFAINIAGSTPTVFHAISSTGNFRIDDVRANFTGVPEPTSFTLLGMLIGPVIMRRKKRV